MVVNVPVIELYAVLIVVEYLHIAASFVANDKVAVVVPTGNVPLGAPLLLTGGTVSNACNVVNVKSWELARFPAASLDLTR